MQDRQWKIKIIPKWTDLGRNKQKLKCPNTNVGTGLRARRPRQETRPRRRPGEANTASQTSWETSWESRPETRARRVQGGGQSSRHSTPDQLGDKTGDKMVRNKGDKPGDKGHQEGKSQGSRHGIPNQLRDKIGNGRQGRQEHSISDKATATANCLGKTSNKQETFWQLTSRPRAWRSSTQCSRATLEFEPSLDSRACTGANGNLGWDGQCTGSMKRASANTMPASCYRTYSEFIPVSPTWLWINNSLVSGADHMPCHGMPGSQKEYCADGGRAKWRQKPKWVLLLDRSIRSTQPTQCPENFQCTLVETLNPYKGRLQVLKKHIFWKKTISFLGKKLLFELLECFNLLISPKKIMQFKPVFGSMYISFS